ncbi:2-hydroxyacid dehydrogenase [Martelella alba]|uniref:Lactate dehydrogenase n=1 Tax=Martelella alba TaxID=2590451 RepID=A0ABY2SQH1_9HYPH|nr:2-hydroxyacid dehydrogenase [Martelella alba]TKI08220.1 lactate dehydrogenase [Martelella alba]
MRVLFAAPDQAWGNILAQFRQALPEVEFVAAGHYQIPSLAGFDVVIPTMTRLDAALLKTSDRLRLIQQAGAGLEGVDLAAARQQGIAVANVPSDCSGNADSVAELAVGMMIALARNIRAIPAALQKSQLGSPMGLGLRGKTAGLVGLGGIGKALAKRLAAFDMRLIGIKQRVEADFARAHHLAWLGTLEDLPVLLEQADFVILSLPDTEATHGLINAANLARMRPGGFLINVGRGGLIDRDALQQALAAGRLAGAGLDVFWQEPPDPNDALFRYNVLATPHIGGVTDVSLAGHVQGVCDNLRRLMRGEEIMNRHA